MTATEHYVQLDDAGQRLGAWAFSDRECFRIDTLPGRGWIYHFTAPVGQDLWDLLAEKCECFKDGPRATFHRLDLKAAANYRAKELDSWPPNASRSALVPHN